MELYEHGGLVYDSDGKLRKCQDMSANINALGLPHSVRKAIHKSIESVIHYPDVSAAKLKSAIARKYNIKIENILTLNGAAEFFYIYFQTVRPERVVIISPTFSEYERAAKAAGCAIKHFLATSDDNFNLDIKKLRKELTKKDCVVICRPNNPTSLMIRVPDLMRIVKKAGTVIVDESFIEFVKNARSLKRYVSDKLIVVQSLTKMYAIPGLRLGFAVCAENTVQQLSQAKDVWNVNSLAQAAGVAALKDTAYVQRTLEWLQTETEYVKERLKKMGIKYYEPTANFVLMRFESETIVEDLITRLKHKNILIRKCDNFVGLDGRYIRMAIRTRSENELALNLMSK